MSNKELMPENADSDLQQMITHRSLYILQKKVELYKPQIDRIYKKHSQKSDEHNAPYRVSIDSLKEVVQELLSKLSLNMIHLTKLNEMFITNFINNERKHKSIEEIQSQLIDYIKGNISKYNQMLIQKRLMTLSKKRKNEAIRDQTSDNDDSHLALKRSIVEYSKHGRVVKSFQVLMKENIDSGVVLSNEQKDGLGNQRKGNEDDGSQMHLYIETLPYIIADYILKNSSLAIIDGNDEFSNEIHSLFDKKIIDKLKEDTVPYQGLMSKSENCKSQISELQKQKGQLTHSTLLYQNIYFEKKKKGEDTELIEATLEKLIAQRIILDNKIGKAAKQVRESSKEKATSKRDLTLPISKDNTPSKDNETEIALKDVFAFYSKQHHSIDSSHLLEATQSKSKEDCISLADFSMFCKDFQLPFYKDKAVSLFKIHATNNQTMSYAEFALALQEIALMLHNSTKKCLWKGIESAKETISLMEQQELEREEEGKKDNLLTEKITGIKQNKRGTIDKASIFYHNTHSQLIEKVFKLKYDFDRLSKKSHERILDDFYANLGLYHSKEYKTKIKGYLKPSCANEKAYRLPNQLAKIKNSIENKELLLLLETKTNDKEDEMKKQELIERSRLYQIKMEKFLSSHKKVTAGHPVEKLRERQYSDIRKTNASLSNEIKEEKGIVKKILFEHNQMEMSNSLKQGNSNDNGNGIESNEKNEINDQYEGNKEYLNQKPILTAKEREPNESLIENNEENIFPIESNTKKADLVAINKAASIKSDMQRSERKLSALLHEPFLKHHNNNSMIQLKTKPNDNLFSAKNSRQSINKSYQAISYNSNQLKGGKITNKLITAGESIIRPALNHSHSQSLSHNHSHYSVNNSYASIQLHNNPN